MNSTCWQGPLFSVVHCRFQDCSSSGCIGFEDYVVFTAVPLASGCSSSFVGLRVCWDGTHGAHPINLIADGLDNVHVTPNMLSYGTGYPTAGVILHEIGHAIGLFHTMSQSNRDTYIKLNLEPGDTNAAAQFNSNYHNVPDADDFDTTKVQYDLTSTMHYSSHLFAWYDGSGVYQQSFTITLDGFAALSLQRATGVDVGQTVSFSKQDIETLNKMYECQDRPPAGTINSILC